VKDVARYVAMPGIIPRVKEFARAGFGSLAQLMAMIYYSVRLLPRHHPYLNPLNKGKFGIRHVIAEAARHIEFKKENADQIVIFAALLAGFILLVIQFALMILAVTVKPAFAASMFVTNAPVTDLAYILLDRIFGIPGLYGSCASLVGSVACNPVTTAFPDPLQTAMHTLFRFYNTAILIVGVLIFVYYILVVVGETATTGTPFGRRFSHVWASLRLVTAIGLLIPLNYGFNTAQYIVLYAAKFGSSFATNGWLAYNDAVAAASTNSPLNVAGLPGAYDGAAYDRTPLLAPPPRPDKPRQLDNIVQFMSIARTCELLYEASFDGTGGTPFINIEPYLVSRNPGAGLPSRMGIAPGPTPDWQTAVNYYNNEDIIIRFGHYEVDAYPRETGGVSPYCGEIIIHTTDLGYQATGVMQDAYYRWVMNLWESPLLADFALRAACLTSIDRDSIAAAAGRPCTAAAFGADDNPSKLPNDTWKQTTVGAFTPAVVAFENVTYAMMETYVNANSGFTNELRERGWAGAGIWYNKIAEMNGAFHGAIHDIPTPATMPSVMVKVEQARQAQNQGMDAENRYNPQVAKGMLSVEYKPEGEADIARSLHDVYQYWRTANTTGGGPDAKPNPNIVINLVNSIFGLDGVLSIQAQHGIHPLAQLSAAGKGILDASVRNLMTGLAFSAGGGMAETLSVHIGAAIGAVSSMFVSFATLGLTIGFILYYVLPFLPFIYFFFAVSAWVKTIFEAMVGAPLWALAHLRIDGEGLPGQAALNGYFLIFEIFVRPILTVFGLLAGMIAFTALATTLNGIFPLVTSNLSGFNCGNAQGSVQCTGTETFRRDAIDGFFFTIVYTVLVYLIGVSSFKMIDQVPQGILRWMGSGASSFAAHHADAADSLTQYAAIGGSQIAGQLAQASGSMARAGGFGLSSAGHGIVNSLTRSGSRIST
jgi:conjugal transfer/type IV secretion protein DotA/TraY